MNRSERTAGGGGSLIERAVARTGMQDGRLAPSAGADDSTLPTDATDRRVTASETPTGHTRRSREVAVDLRRLRAGHFIVPSGDRSRIAEEFRLIKRGILHGILDGTDRGDKPKNVVMVTSARPGEGKTFIAVNLALSTALERDTHVLLIDCDLSQPKVMSVLGIKAEIGLADVLKDQSLDIADVMLRTNIGKLSIIPPGKPNVLAPEMLSSRRMMAIAEQIATRYSDRIIIYDSPPLLATAESAMLVRYAGQVVIVVEAGATSRSTLEAALDVAGPDANAKLILNKVRFRFGSEEFGSYYRAYES